MPQPPIHQFWKDRVKHHLGKGQKPPLGPAVIQRILIEESAKLDSNLRAEYGSAPSVRSIARIRESEWVPLPEEEKVQYRYFYYPESMERGELPWEASAACLELLGSIFISAATGLGDRRPTIRLALAFWRITLAAPDLNVNKRLRYARMWSGWQALGSTANQQDLRPLEARLAYGPWRSKEAEDAFMKAGNMGDFDFWGDKNAH